MNLGGFEFDFPLWILYAANGTFKGFACCQVDGQNCLSVLTDCDLTEPYLEIYSTVDLIVIPVQINSSHKLATTIEECFDLELATHIAFDHCQRDSFFQSLKQFPF